ncbi:MAG TPA: 4-hydroxy-2-oxovalerate aldolase [Solirubrobacterales bacterium]|nr:4-hydroxy-2-oxovalerate aldolase [Solirubrobacterales bacterium]
MSLSILDVTARDGSHTVRHSFTPSQVEVIVTRLGEAGVKIAEIGHGEGLGASSITYGISATREEDLIAAGVEAGRPFGVRIAVVVLPGIGTGKDLARAVDAGASVARVSTLCTEADVGVQHIEQARELGCLTVGFLMMAHLAPPEKLAEQALVQAAAGAEIVYCTDSAGALTMEDVAARIARMREVLPADVQVGFHGHNNLGLAVANSITAVRGGATFIDTALSGIGAGSGNTATEVFAAVCDRMEIPTGVDVTSVAAAAEEVAEIVDRRPTIDRASLMLGWAGVPSTFLLHSQRAAERYEVEQDQLLLELGRRKIVAGQEDMIIDVAIDLAARR